MTIPCPSRAVTWAFTYIYINLDYRPDVMAEMKISELYALR